MSEAALRGEVQPEEALGHELGAIATAESYHQAIEEPTAEHLDVVHLSEDPVKDYLRKAGEAPLLDAEGEVELAKRIEVGLFAKHKLAEEDIAPDHRQELEWLAQDGQAAKEQFIRANMRLVVKFARRYKDKMEFLDLIQEGNIGLIRAVEKFDYAKGYKFSTYAGWWIRQAIGRGVTDKARTIRLPTHVAAEVNRVQRARRDFAQEHGRVPTDEEVATESGMPVARIIKLDNYDKDPISLSTPVGPDGDGEFGDLIRDGDEPEAHEVAAYALMRETVRDVIGGLTEREQLVISMRFGLLDDGEEHTLDKISKVVGLTRERIRQIEHEVVAKLREDGVMRARLKPLWDELDE